MSTGEKELAYGRLSELRRSAGTWKSRDVSAIANPPDGVPVREQSIGDIVR